MAQTLEAIQTPEGLCEQLAIMRENPEVVAALCDLGGGVLRFADIVFDNPDSDQVYAQTVKREPEGKGPHFDVYGPLIDKNFPLLAVFNLAGRAAVRAAILPADLTKAYRNHHPMLTEAAADARRHYSALALDSPHVEVYEGEIGPAMGMVLPQGVRSRHIVHEITPTDSDDPGSYVKMIVPANGEAESTLFSQGYVTLDHLITAALEPDNTRTTRSLIEVLQSEWRPSRVSEGSDDEELRNDPGIGRRGGGLID